MAETSRFLTTQGLGGPEGGQQSQGLRAGRKAHAPNRTPTGSGPAGPGNFGYFPSLESSSPGGEISPSLVSPAGDYSYKLKFTVFSENNVTRETDF